MNMELEQLLGVCLNEQNEQNNNNSNKTIKFPIQELVSFNQDLAEGCKTLCDDILLNLIRYLKQNHP